MPQKEIDPIEEKSYAKFLFVFGSLFFLVSLWTSYDEFVVRRSWKHYQRAFNKLELTRVEEEYRRAREALDAEESRREQAANPNEPSLRLIRLEREKAEIQREGEEFQKADRELRKREIRLSDLNQRYGFAKADQDEVFYEWKHALERGDVPEVEAYEREYYELEARLSELQSKVREAEEEIDEVRAIRDRFDDEVQRWEEAEKKYLEPLKKLTAKREAIRSRGLDIKQVVIEDLGRGGEVQWGTVDRCESCHVAINREGFENEKNPFKTHPAEIFKNHPIEQFGCTTCHGGQGRATQIKGTPLGEGDYVHGFVPHWQDPLLEGDFLQSSCHKCHVDQWKLPHAAVYEQGKRLFWDLGCTGCHAVQGFEKAPKVGPSLLKVASKVQPEWLVAWIKNPRNYLPHTRMPTLPLDLGDEELTDEEGRQLKGVKDQVQKIAAYLLQSSEPYPLPFGRAPGGNVLRGKEIFETGGCYGCHTLGQKGTGLAPALDRIASKTPADWIYNWIQDPKAFSPEARMPSLRLNPQEAADITAFLMKPEKPEEDPELRTALQNPENAKAGFRIIADYGCYACHTIKGFEQFSKPSVELTTIGKKETVLLDFGDTKIPRTWEAWVEGKLKDPRRYLTEKTSSRMPNFGLTDQEIHALVVFLKGLRNEKVHPRFVMSNKRPEQQGIDEGRRLVERLHCKGCHLIEGEGRLIEPFLDDPGKAPPNLAGIGARVRPEWMFAFLKDPSKARIRPWIDLRMPTFGFSDDEANTIIHYFSGLDRVRADFYSPGTPPPMHPEVKAQAEKLVSKEYFSCYSCHIRGSVTPLSPPQQWGPDLTLVRERIRPEFLPEWIKDPQRFTPGVNMPAFLPTDDSAPQDILGGDRHRQAEAVRDYLLNLH